MIKDIIKKYQMKRQKLAGTNKFNFELFYDKFTNEISQVHKCEEEICVNLIIIYDNKEWEVLNDWLIAARYHLSDSYVDILNKYLATEDSGASNEAVIEILDELHNPRSINALQKSLEFQFEQDIGYGRIDKIFDALERIGTYEAIEVIREMQDCSDPYIANEAKEIIECYNENNMLAML